MAVSTKDFTTLVREQVTAIQGAASTLLNFTQGSILKAIVQANSAVALWLQGSILQLLAYTRAASCKGADLDSWMADFGLTRLPAIYATGVVNFARFTPSGLALVPVGAKVQTADGSQQYLVIVDTNNPTYSLMMNGYTLTDGVASIAVPIQAVVAGSAANVGMGTISTMIQAIPGVDTVSNPAALTNGVDAESDKDFRARFVAYIASLSKATRAAVAYAILNVRAGLSYTLTENLNYSGLSQPGYFYAVVDDGTGVPSSTLLSTVSNAIEAVRPLTVSFGVFAPSIILANVSMAITTTTGYDHNVAVNYVKTAVNNYVNGLGLGNSLTYTRLAQVAYDACPGVINVSSVLINNATSDLTAASNQTLKIGTIVVA